MSTAITAPTVSGITYAGAALTKAGSTRGEMNSDPNEGESEIWYLVNPATGSNTVSVSMSGTATDFFAGAETFYNVNQVNPIGTAVTTNNGNVQVTPQTLSVTSTSNNQMIVDSIVENNGSWTPGAGQTEVESSTIGSLVRGGNSYRTGLSGSTTMSWTPGGADWYGLVAIAINSAKANPETPLYAPTLDQLMRGGKWMCPASECAYNSGMQPYTF